jgi:hypothetical protein
MPRAPIEPPLHDLCQRAREMYAAAMQFVAPERGQAIARKWVPRDVEAMSADRMIATAADAALLLADFLLSCPSASGSTAFDRLAKRRVDAEPAEAAAIAALRKARFRLLQLEEGASPDEVPMRDAVSGEILRIADARLPPLPPGTMLFGRVAMLGDGIACLPGVTTPLDAAASAVARQHAAAGAHGAGADTRWAEAVYSHVLRNGTLEVPGLNRPATDADEEDEEDEWLELADDGLIAVAMEWADLEEAALDAELLQRTRKLTDTKNILDALTGALLAAAAGEEAVARAFERLLLVQLETVERREQGGSGTLTLDAVARALDEAIAAEQMSPDARALFVALRRRIGGARSAADPALERLVQRIQALRAKTVAQGCTEQEALAAAEKVAELLDRHGLSLGELEFRAQPCDGIKIDTNRRRLGPIDQCVPEIAAFFDCRVWAEMAKGAPIRYVFFGLRGDVAAAQYLYEMVERAFATETAAFRAGDLYGRMHGERRSATNSFEIGLARGICDKLRAMRAARDAHLRSASGRDLVPMKAAIVDDEVAKLGLDLRAREMGQRSRRVLTDAFQAGKAAGQRFEFAPAITRAA